VALRAALERGANYYAENGVVRTIGAAAEFCGKEERVIESIS